MNAERITGPDRQSVNRVPYVRVHKEADGVTRIALARLRNLEGGVSSICPPEPNPRVADLVMQGQLIAAAIDAELDRERREQA